MGDRKAVKNLVAEYITTYDIEVTGNVQDIFKHAYNKGILTYEEMEKMFDNRWK